MELPIVYFIPSIIGRKKRNITAIVLLNLFAGWTFVEWIVALVWAVSKDYPKPNYEFMEVKKDDKFDRLSKLKDLFDSGVLSLCIIFSTALMVTGNQAFAQEDSTYSGRQFVWIKEGVALTIGQKVEYKTITSDRFEKGELISFTDFTLVFQQSGTVKIIRHDELEELKFYTPRKKLGKKIGAGIALIVVGGLIAVIFDSFYYASGSNKSPPPPSGPSPGDIAGGIIMAGGLTYIVVSVSAKPKALIIKLQSSK